MARKKKKTRFAKMKISSFDSLDLHVYILLIKVPAVDQVLSNITRLKSLPEFIQICLIQICLLKKSSFSYIMPLTTKFLPSVFTLRKHYLDSVMKLKKKIPTHINLSLILLLWVTSC